MCNMTNITDILIRRYLCIDSYNYSVYTFILVVLLIQLYYTCIL